MAAVFIRLKVRLLLSGLRSSGQRQFFFVLGALFGVGGAIAGFAGLAAAGRSGDTRIVPILFALLTVGWVLFPIFAFGVDELLDPARLALLPLTGRAMLGGLLASGLVGIPPIATAIALCGAFVGFAHTPAAVIIVAAAIVAELLLCLVLSRAVTTALSGLLRSRRGRDVTAVILALVGASLGGLGPVIGAAVTRLDTPLGRALSAGSRFSPLGVAGAAVAAAGTADYAVAGGQLALSTAYITAALVWWHRSLGRALTSVEETARTRSADRSADLRPRWTRWLLPNSAIGAVAAKDLRYLWRDPMRRSAVLATIGPASVMIISTFASGAGDPRTVLFAMAAATLLSVIALNQFGLDGAAYWMNIVAGNDPRRDLLGKNIAVALIAIPATAVVATIVAALTGGWVYIPLAIAGGVAGCGGALGVANIVSVKAPAPQPENMSNAWSGGGGGQSMAAGVTQFGALLLVAVLLAPLGGFIGFSAITWSPGLFIAVPLSLGYGALLWYAGLRWSIRHLWWRQAELLQAIRPRKAA